MTAIPGSVPLWLAALFVAQVLVMASLVVLAVGARRGVGTAVGAGLALGGWLAATALLADAGVFEDFSRLPPRLLLALAPPLLAIIWLCRSQAVARLLDETPPGWLVYPQSFRITRPLWTRRAAIWWNAGGVVILANVVVHAQLAAPTPFRVFHVEPPVTFIAHVPWIWLPAFLVPLAWALHALSMRQFRRHSSAGHVGYADSR